MNAPPTPSRLPVFCPSRFPHENGKTGRREDESICAHSTAADDPILGRLHIAAPESAVGEFMFMPAGPQTISATKGIPGGPRKEIVAHVLIERGAEVQLQKQMEAINARGGDRAYFDFNHEDRDASFWPARFTWKESPRAGVYVSGEWSEPGKAAIEGRSYRSFSPVFHVDDSEKKPCRIICRESARPNMGGLVNNPAFKNNLPLWAKHTGANASGPSPNPSVIMTKEELALLQAKIANMEQEIAGLVAGSTGSAEESDAITAKRSELAALQKDAELEGLRQENAAIKQQHLELAAKEVETEINAAIRDGRIQPRNEALIASWRKRCLADPANLELLRLMPKPTRILEPGGASTRWLPSTATVRESNAAVLGQMSSLAASQLKPSVRYRDRPLIAKELAALYAKEILPRLKEGDDIALNSIMGSNSLGTLAQSLVATRTLELLTLTFPLLSSIMTDFSDQIVSYGDTLTSRYVGIPSVATFNTTTGWPTYSGVTTTDVAITYNQFKGVPVQFLGHEVAGTVRRLFEEIAPAQSYALGKDIVDYIYALITSAYTNTVTQAGLGTFGRSTVIDIGGILDDAANPDMGRFLLLNRPYYSALSKDNTIIQLAAFQKADVITRGMEASTLQDVEGFRVFKAVNLPATVISGATVLKGFAASKSALALATRLSADYVNAIPGAGNGNLTVVTTPGGFSANMVQFVDHNGAYAAQRLEVIYGASRGQIAAGALLTDV